MNDVFISYAREDERQAGRLAGLLGERGWSVFWDRSVPPGGTWDEHIGRELDDARAVVVLWSEASIASEWVTEEAHEGKARGVLVPVLLEAVRPPFGFRRIQAASLVGWSGEADHAGFGTLVDALSGVLGEALGAGAEHVAPVEPAAMQRAVDSGGSAEDAGSVKEASARPARDAGAAGGEAAGAAVPVPEMVEIPAGSFRMGSEDGNPDERPVHTVTIAKPFFIGRYEVSFDEYDAFAAATGRPLPNDGGWGRGDRPVVNVSWQDASAYAAWLSGQTGKRYRLPSEAEWEYAARAGSETRYWWGDEVQRDGKAMANCAGCGSQWDRTSTAPVGQFEANGFGLHDTHGNVWEWVQDCWHGSYEGAPDDGGAWLEGEEGDRHRRVLRGGSWEGGPRSVRSAYRGRVIAVFSRYDVGFRLAEDP